MNEPQPLHLFEGFGVELEYMIVQRQSLDVSPIADRLIWAVAGAYESEVEFGSMAWSNELVLHVVELKTNGPSHSLTNLADDFHGQVRRINQLLVEFDAQLLPTAMHPWMNPELEMRLWPHEHCPVYERFHKIFDCRGHGWANLQSVHLNLPFADDSEFGRLHNAIRLVLPLIPAIAASSPFVGDEPTGVADNRMEFYRKNSVKVPRVAGKIVPEPIQDRASYEQQILQPMYEQIAPLDPKGILRHEWLNARGAIARFDRQTIEIRVIDVQECPAADLAIVGLIAAVLRAMTDQRWTDSAAQGSIDTDTLHELLLATISDGDDTMIRDRDFLRQFGYNAPRCRAGDLWQYLFTAVQDHALPNVDTLTQILERGTLSRRMLEEFRHHDSSTLATIYRELADCLANNRLYLP